MKPPAHPFRAPSFVHHLTLLHQCVHAQIHTCTQAFRTLYVGATGHWLGEAGELPVCRPMLRHPAFLSKSVTSPRLERSHNPPLVSHRAGQFALLPSLHPRPLCRPLFCGSCKKGRAPGQGALAPDDPGIWLGASLVDHTHIERKRTRTCFAAVRWRQPIFETASERGAQGAALHVDPSPRPPFLPELYPALRSGPYSNVTCSWLQHDRANAAAPVVPVVRRRAAAQTTIAATTATA